MRYFVLSFILFFVSCNEAKENAELTDNKNEFQLDGINMATLAGEKIDWNKYKGKVVFINFWATWCGPCLKEMPSIENAMRILKGKNIEFLFASDESVDVIEKFKNDNNFPFNYVQVLNQQELNIMALPTTFIFSSDGKLAFNEPGLRYWDRKENIDLLLNKIE